MPKSPVTLTCVVALAEAPRTRTPLLLKRSLPAHVTRPAPEMFNLAPPATKDSSEVEVGAKRDSKRSTLTEKPSGNEVGSTIVKSGEMGKRDKDQGELSLSESGNANCA